MRTFESGNELDPVKGNDPAANVNPNRDEYGDPDVHEFPEIDGSRIVGVNKNEDQDLREFLTADGTVHSYDDVINAILEGRATGLKTQTGNNGDLVVRSAPDGYRDNNLDRIPSFKA